MKTLKDQFAEAKERIQSIWAKANEEGRDLTAEEQAELDEISAKAEQMEAHLERAAKSKALIDRISRMKTDHDPNDDLPGSFATGRKGYLRLSGRDGKELARSLATRTASAQGAKAFIGNGTVTTPVPLRDEPVELGRVPTSVLELLRVTAHDVPVWRYLRQTARTNNTAIVAPGSQKPTSVVTTQSVDGALAVFAHLSEYVDEYLLRDNDQLQSFLAAQLTYMLQVKVEDEVINGDGSTGHLEGILNTSGIQTQQFNADRLTTLRLAALKLEKVGYSADAFILSTDDWAVIETTRATMGQFDLGGPIDRAQQRVWGTPVVTTTQLAPGTAIALDLDAVGLDLGAEGVQVRWDSSTGFDRNQVRARVEGRFGVSVYQPAAIVEVNLAVPEGVGEEDGTDPEE